MTGPYSPDWNGPGGPGAAYPQYQPPVPQVYAPPAVGYPAGPAPYPATVGGPLVSTRSDKSVQAVFAWIFTVLTLGYFLPWAIAATRGKSNSAAIGVLNFLLGWTLVGWIVALVMACSAHQLTGGVVVQQTMAVNVQMPYPTQPGYQQPAYQQPGYQQPGYPPPAYQQPGPPPPAYAPPAYQSWVDQPPTPAYPPPSQPQVAPPPGPPGIDAASWPLEPPPELPRQI